MIPRTIAYLYGLQARGMKFGLRNVRRLVAAAGHPENAFPSLHVAGSNGKGSTAAFLASVFMESGYRTGLYTSPHLVRFNERITINGEEITDDDIVRLVRGLKPAIERTGATFFEATTTLAFMYFAEQDVDVAVIETGLGGRLDATNVLVPMVSVITSVSREHTEILGDTLGDIAREKGGIIKPGVPVVTAVTAPEALGVLERIAARRGARLVRMQEEVRAVRSRSRPGAVTLRSSRLRVSSVRPGLRGPHQAGNAALAVASLSALLRIRGPAGRFAGITSEAVRRGLERVRVNTGIRGRLEQFDRKTLLDVAHNPEGMRTLVGALGKGRRKRWTVVFGVMKDKELGPMGRELLRIARLILAVRPRTRRAVPAAALAHSLRALGAESEPAGGVEEGIRRALRRNSPILVTGSHYVVGEAIQVLERMRLRARGT